MGIGGGRGGVGVSLSVPFEHFEVGHLVEE